MTYCKWFLKEGWKQYSVPFLLGSIITTCIVHQLEYVISAPVGIAIGIIVTMLGFDIGIVAHSIMNYKANKDK